MIYLKIPKTYLNFYLYRQPIKSCILIINIYFLMKIIKNIINILKGYNY